MIYSQPVSYTIVVMATGTYKWDQFIMSTSLERASVTVLGFMVNVKHVFLATT